MVSSIAVCAWLPLTDKLLWAVIWIVLQLCCYLFFVLHALTSNTTDDLLCLEDKGRSPFNMNWTFYVYHEWWFSSPAINCCFCSLFNIQWKKVSLADQLRCVEYSFVLDVQSALLLHLRVYTLWFSTACFKIHVQSIVHKPRTTFFNAVLSPSDRQNSLGNCNNLCLNIAVKFLDSLINSKFLCSLEQL